MLEVLREMCTMSGKLKDFINETEDKEEKHKLLEKYYQLNEQMQILANKVFDENDGFSRETIEKIIATEKVIKEFKENQIQLINVFVHLIDIIANVEKILLGCGKSQLKKALKSYLGGLLARKQIALNIKQQIRQILALDLDINLPVHMLFSGENSFQIRHFTFCTFVFSPVPILIVQTSTFFSCRVKMTGEL